MGVILLVTKGVPLVLIDKEKKNVCFGEEGYWGNK